MTAQAVGAHKSAAPTGSLGLWVFLASEMLFFGVLFLGYLVTRLHHSQGFVEASRHTEWLLGGINTAVLLTSSLTVALAVLSAKARAKRACAWMLAATLLLGLTFLTLKLLEYTHDFEHHLVPWRPFAVNGADPAGARQFFFLYFVMTGAHAVHLVVGLAVIASLLIGLSRRADLRRATAEAVELGALYWHLVDIIWIFLYPLLYLVSRA